MPDWTDEQKRVINSPAREIICGAAAGSGKTAVLVERVFRLISEGASPESFLIITFTNAAAAEMKEKIRNRLLEGRDDPKVRNALDKVNLMQISTIHSFCQHLLRNEFQVSGLDPLFTICDTAEREILFAKAFRKACDFLRDDPEEEKLFSHFREVYTVKAAEDLVGKLYHFLMSLPDPWGWLKEKIEFIPTSMNPAHPWFSTVRLMAEEKLRAAEMTLNRMYKELQDTCALDACREIWKADAELFHVKQSWFSHPEEPPKPASFVAMRGLPRNLTMQESDWKDRYKELREKYKKEINEMDRLLMADPTGAIEEWETVRENLEELAKLTKKTADFFTEAKRKKSVADFNDLEQEAVKILEDPICLGEVQEEYRYIFVDECQDVSAVQDAIIQKLHSEKSALFMVGDVKQSIYRFRLAEPSLFLERMQAYDTSEDPDQVFLPLRSNFRSRPEILETTNRVFSDIMRKDVTELDYTERDALIPGRKTEGTEKVFIDLIKNDGKEYPDLAAVADHITHRIEELRETKYPGEERNYMYRDCVILMPVVRDKGAKLAELLRSRQVPVFFDGDGEFYTQPEILYARCLLQVVQNYRQDLQLLAVLKEVPFLFTDQDLAEIRLRDAGKGVYFWQALETTAQDDSPLGQRCANVLEKLKRWHWMAEFLHLGDFVWYIYQETGYYDICSADPEGGMKQANLRMLCDQACDAEKNGILTLRDFLLRLQDRLSGGDQQTATQLGEKDDMVRIMTIHKSKGLQFPVVFCAGLDQSPEGRDAVGIRIHAELGVTLPYRDPEHRISRPTLADDVFKWRSNRDQRAEKVRLLYVAMTRAQEKLYMISTGEKSPVWSMPAGSYRITAAKTFMDWVVPPLSETVFSTGYAQDANPWEIRAFDSNSQKIVENKKDIHNLGSWLDSVLSGPPVDNLWKNDQPENTSDTLVKRSVTTLVRQAQEKVKEDPEETLEETAETKRAPEQISRRVTQFDIPDLPAFMAQEGKLTAAMRGTLHHRILSLVKLEKIRDLVFGEKAEGSELLPLLRQEITSQKQDMIKKHMMSVKEAEHVEDGRIARFFLSSLGRRMLRSEEVHREWNFNYVREEEHMLLQGVIDCVFREGDGWILVDYKTDYIADEQAFVEEYTPQLLWYARALEGLTGLKVKEKYLYSLSLSKEFPLRG